MARKPKKFVPPKTMKVMKTLYFDGIEWVSNKINVQSDHLILKKGTKLKYYGLEKDISAGGMKHYYDVVGEKPLRSLSFWEDEFGPLVISQALSVGAV